MTNKARLQVFLNMDRSTGNMEEALPCLHRCEDGEAFARAFVGRDNVNLPINTKGGSRGVGSHDFKSPFLTIGSGAKTFGL